MEIVRKSSITTLSNSGVQSEQLLFPENSSSRRVTITRVTVEPKAVNPPHRHPASEQIWVALEGNGILLLDDERTEPFCGRGRGPVCGWGPAWVSQRQRCAVCLPVGDRAPGEFPRGLLQGLEQER